MSFLEGDLWGAVKIFFLSLFLSFFFVFCFLILLSVALGV